MTSESKYQDDDIQLINIASEQGSNDNLNIQSPLKLIKFKKKNKVESPIIQSPHLSGSSTRSNVSDIFIVRNQNIDETAPVPAPRNLKTTSKEIEIQHLDKETKRIKKLSETTETVSGDVQSLFSTKSETISYKEQLRNRFLSVKKQAENSVIKKDVKLNKNKKKKFLEAVEAILQNEDSVVNDELQKYEKGKSKMGKKVEEIDPYDFFCNINEIQDNTEEDNNISPNHSEDAISESSKQSLTDFLGVNNLDTDIIEYVHPEILDIGLYGKELFKSKTSIVPKLRNGEIIFKSFEDEGIFKNDNTHINKRELRILEERLSYDDNRDWFDTDGQLKILPDPRLENYFKPFESNITHNDFVHKYTPPSIYESIETNLNINDNTLEIILHELQFNHHPLFSSEHVLANQLIQFYNKYNQVKSENSYLILTKKLDAIRCAKNRLFNQIQASGDAHSPLINKFEKYEIEIKEIRSKIYCVAQTERKVKKSILITWKLLKSLRTKQKFANTNLKLVIKKIYEDYEIEVLKWEQNISDEVSEILEEFEFDFLAELRDYKEELKQWKLKKKHLDEGDDELGDKPKKPIRNFDEDEIKLEVLEKCNECLKPPGEPVVDFELTNENNYDRNIQNQKEITRRNVVNKTQIFIRILCNNREICKSKVVTLNNKFVCNFNEQISVKLYKLPNILNIEIYQQLNTINKQQLAEFEINVPDFETTIENSETIRETFINKDILKYNHTAIGTGITLNEILKNDELELEESLFTKGTFSFNLGWTIENISNNPKIKSQVNIPTIFDIEHLEEWIKNSPDPQDPQNALFFDYINNLDTTESEKNYFRMDPDLKDLEFCDDEELDNNLRFKMLKLRDNNEPEFRGIVVPNRVKEILPQMFEAYEKRCKEETVSAELLQDKLQEDNIDTQRKWADKYMEQAENKIIQLSKLAERKILLKDVLTEEVIPSLGSLGLSFMNWLQPKRPLRPVRKPVKQKTTAVTFKDMKIMVNIIGAIQVPIRKDMDALKTKSEQIDFVSVRPFVVVSFQDETVRTTVAEGPNPIWNQELNIPLKYAPGNLSASSLQNIKDSLYFNLYDETVSDLIEDDRIRDTNIHQQLGCNWLGGIEIPFTTLLCNNRIEGTFKLNLPQILLGYERQSIKTFHTSRENFAQKIDSFLTVFITLQPNAGNIQQLINNELACTELQYVEEYITNWQNEYNHLYPQRQFSSFVTNVNGERCCITRYFKPIKLPQLDPEFAEITEHQCAKYVSLIPFRENAAAGLIPDIWLSSEQLLTLMMGSMKDHAVLLTCYFMSMGVKTWLLLGYGMPNGFTAYVLTRENGSVGYEFFIYDVKTAQKYNIHDNICPLQKVFCVINDENVWANIQDEERLHVTKFEFTKSSDWLQLFGREVSAPTSAYHHINFNYFEPISVMFLQEKIEKKLRKQIMKWRKHSRTIWNHYCNITLKQLLPKLEENCMEQNDFIDSPDNLSELQNLLSSYQINGFAFNMPYTSISKIVHFVHTTGIHLNENPNIEFSLSVYVHSYLNNAIVIWLYLATLIRRR